MVYSDGNSHKIASNIESQEVKNGKKSKVFKLKKQIEIKVDEKGQEVIEINLSKRG